MLIRILCCLVVAVYAPSHAIAQPAHVPLTNSFTGAAPVGEWVSFSSINKMNIDRRGHTATLLSSGKVLVTGGDSVGSAVEHAIGNDAISSNVAELYDPAMGIWSVTGNMNVARSGLTATLLSDGKVLVVGGEVGEYYDTNCLSSAELYDPTAGTWSVTGSMSFARAHHTATLLSDGKVLVVGGYSAGYSGIEDPIYWRSATSTNVAELYDPATGKWSVTDSMSIARANHTATLLAGGKVLVAGGDDNEFLNRAEIYNPATDTWNDTGSMNAARTSHTATLLPGGKVLVAGGYDHGYLISAELYDVTTGIWNITDNMSAARASHTATLLPDGKVFVTGRYGYLLPGSTEYYDPTTSKWNATENMFIARQNHTATLLPDGKVLVAGGLMDAGGMRLNRASAELATVIPPHTLTGTMGLPSGWANTNPIPLGFVATTTGTAPNAGSLSNDGTIWGDWIDITAGVTTPTTWDVGSDGGDKPVTLRLRNTEGQVVTVVTGTVNVDTTAPEAAVSVISPYQTNNPTFPVTWSGTDATSGIDHFDIQFRDEASGEWTDWQILTTATTSDFTGQDGHTYAFRARAQDHAGNLSIYSTGDTQTTVDLTPPVAASLILNGGALTSTDLNLSVALSASDQTSGVAKMSFSNDGVTWGDWQNYATITNWLLQSGDGTKIVYLRVQDAAGNISLPIHSTIEVDTTVDSDYTLSINHGVLFTNQIAVTLDLGARSQTAQMMLSNDGGFAGAHWEPYGSHKAWTITQYGSYVIPRLVYVRYKDVFGSISATFQDDIILDVNPPTGSISVVSSSLDGSSPRSQTSTSITLQLSATDDVSGVGFMRLAEDQTFIGAQWQAYTTTYSWLLGAKPTIYVQFRDNAGNESSIYSAPLPITRYLFLPAVVR
jgi:N-acetylneuraminic acid mutarotase